MNIPQFNGEASLYQTSTCYYVTGQSEGTMPSSLIPQLGGRCWAVCGSDPDCLRCCLCVSRGGDPSQCCY
jgi:hypothetical protein